MKTDSTESLYRYGFNNSMEGATRLLELRVEICEKEKHECPDQDFAKCDACESVDELMREYRGLMEKWGTEWALFVTGDAYPLPSTPTWCICGHVSGQHGIDYPHVCATGGHEGCENGCQKFVPDAKRCACGPDYQDKFCPRHGTEPPEKKWNEAQRGGNSDTEK